GVTASPWTPVSDGDGNGSGRAVANRPLNVDAQARIGGGGGGGGGWAGGGGGMVGNFLAPTPELMAKVAKLPPALDEPDVDLSRQTSYDQTFTLKRFTRPFR